MPDYWPGTCEPSIDKVEPPATLMSSIVSLAPGALLRTTAASTPLDNIMDTMDLIGARETTLGDSSVLLSKPRQDQNQAGPGDTDQHAPPAKALKTAVLGPSDSQTSFVLTGNISLPNSDPTNYARNAQWCADGQAVLFTCENGNSEVLLAGGDLELKPSLSVNHPAPVLSAAWFPTASPSNPASYCFVEAVRNSPIKLVDASNGRLRASYKIVDHRERFIAPHSMAFNMYTNKLYCGFEDAIEVFDVYHPGSEGSRIHTVPTKKSRDGLKGIVSTLAFAFDWSGVYAAGSFLGGITLLTEDTGAQIQGWLEGVDKGVTQIKFNPSQPHLVHAAFRQTPTIATWDIRNPAEPVAFFDRGITRTNQRLWFDVSQDGKWLVSGDETGEMRLFDAHSTTDGSSQRASIKAHHDAIGATSFHPTQPFVLTGSGSRHFDEPMSDDSSQESSDIEGVEMMVSGTWSSVHGSPEKTERYRPRTRDNSVKLWSYESLKS